MYQLAVGCIFKNEAHCMKEWITHYLHHGAEHFYMIDDASTDNFMPIIEEFKGYVTLFHAHCDYYLGRQRVMYNQFILPHLKETKWLLMVDMDEFVWSPQCINLTDILNNCWNLGQIQFYDALFGSNGYIAQPEFLVNSFTKRQEEPRKQLKYFINSNYEFSSLNIHHATFVHEQDEKDKFIILGYDTFINNNYCCQSKEFWINVKCTRGDGDHYLVRTPEDFDRLDKNEVEDLRLKEQNQSIQPIIIVDMNKY